MYTQEYFTVGDQTNKTDVKIAVLNKAKRFIRAINHPLRRKILELISERPGIKVTEIYVKLRIEQSVASQHLGILRNAKCVRAERDGKKQHYYVEVSKIASNMDALRNLV